MPQGKHRKTILEVPTEVLVKREGSLGEACALSLLSITLGCPMSILVPGAGVGISPCSAQVRRHGLPLVSHGVCGAPGSEGSNFMGAQRAGRRSHGGHAS